MVEIVEVGDRGIGIAGMVLEVCHGIFGVVSLPGTQGTASIQTVLDVMLGDPKGKMVKRMGKKCVDAG